MTPELKPKGYDNSFLGSGNSRCKGPGTELNLVWKRKRGRRCSQKCKRQAFQGLKSLNKEFGSNSGCSKKPLKSLK